MTFTVSDKLVKLRDGESYDLAKYVEGTDYVRRNIRYGTKVVFRKGFLGEVAETSEPALTHVEPDYTAFNEQEVLPEDWRATQIISEPAQVISSQDVQECKIKKVHTNFKWVETDKGRVWVGLKGSNMRAGQVIRVKDGQLFTGKTGPSGSMVRI